jgi:hypothetical protein
MRPKPSLRYARDALPEATWIVTTFIAVIGVGAALWRNKVLRDQLKLARESTRPKVELTDLHPTGGGTAIDSTVYAQNVGGRPTQAVVKAAIGGDVVYESGKLDLLMNAPRTGVMIHVPRPRYGDLMPECGHATTLYGQTLSVTAEAEDEVVEVRWEDSEYDPLTDRARWEVQQRYWRQGRGEDTAEDRREEAVSRYEERRDA